MMQPPTKQLIPIITAAASVVNTPESATKQQHHHQSKQRMSQTTVPCHSAIQALIEINTAGVAFLQAGNHAQALVWFRRGLSFYGVDLTQFGMPSSCTDQQQQEETPVLPELPLATSPNSSILGSVDLTSVQSATAMEQDHTTPFELYANALLVKSDDPNDEAQLLMPAVLLYNTALLVHLQAVSTRDHYTAHELYRWSLFFMEEAILQKRCSQQPCLQSDLLLLALFNNLCQLNSLFYLPERVALCREKLVQVLTHSHPAKVGARDHAFFYEQLVFSANLFPAAAPAA